jgi:hypothetical protein
MIMKEKSQNHTWEFTKFFRAGVYKWNGTALASKRIIAAVTEIKKAAEKEPVLAAEGAVKFLEKCWAALVHIDSSSGAIGNAVNNALYTIAEIFANVELPIHKRAKLIERIWECWQEEDYGYYDVLGELWSRICKETEIMTFWADTFLPVVRDVFSSTIPGAYFKGTEPCLGCLFETGRYNEILALLKNKDRMLFHYRKYEVMVTAAQGDIDGALEMLDNFLQDPYTSSYAAARVGEELLMKLGRTEEAYKRYAFKTDFHATGLATFSAIRKKYPGISPQRILNDLIDADPGNERRYFAAARKVGMIELAIEIAEKFDVEPKTLTTAGKDYVQKDPELSLRFGLLALERYADGHGYEPEFADVMKCHDIVCAAAANAGRSGEVAEKVKRLAEHDRSPDRLVAKTVNLRGGREDNIIPFRPRR